MWNWLVSALASDATLLLYDGSPFHPDGNVLFDFADATGMTLFGTSAKFIDAVEQGVAVAGRTRTISSSVRTIDVHRIAARAGELRLRLRAHQADVHLASISGGTDIVGCFALRQPGRAGLARRDPGARPRHGGRGVRRSRAARCDGQKGELVCTKPFPSMPIGFWNDPDGEQISRCVFRRTIRACGDMATTPS